MVNIKSPDEERMRSLSPNDRLIHKDSVLFQNLKHKDWNGAENGNDLTKKPDCSTKPKKRIIDYESWNKYDVDSELKKIDVEQELVIEEEKEDRTSKYDRVKEDKKEERTIQYERVKHDKEIDKLEEQEKEVKEQDKRLEIAKLENLANEAGAAKLSDTEQEILAEEERVRGNECYVAKNFTEARKHYTASILHWPTAKAYNNRAACYIRQCKFSAALDDANNCLRLDPGNVKALFRRSIAYQHKNLFREALADMTEVLRKEPKQVLALHIINDLREQCLTLPRTLRFMRDKDQKVLEISSKDLDSCLCRDFYEVNDWNLPKVMCQCSGTARSLQLLPRRCIRPQHTNYDRRVMERRDVITCDNSPVGEVDSSEFDPDNSID